MLMFLVRQHSGKIVAIVIITKAKQEERRISIMSVMSA